MSKEELIFDPIFGMLMVGGIALARQPQQGTVLRQRLSSAPLPECRALLDGCNEGPALTMAFRARISAHDDKRSGRRPLFAPA